MCGTVDMVCGRDVTTIGQGGASVNQLELWPCLS
jgi:hypothetical protein